MFTSPPYGRTRRLDHLCHPGRRVVGWLTFWLDNLGLDDLLRLGVVTINRCWSGSSRSLASDLAATWTSSALGSSRRPAGRTA